MAVTEGREAYLERLLKETRDCLVAVEQACRGYAEQGAQEENARGALDRCATILADCDVRRLIRDVDRAFEPPDTPLGRTDAALRGKTRGYRTRRL